MAITHFIVDASSGTILPAQKCYLLHADDFPDDDAFACMSDDAVSAFAAEHGRAVLPDVQAVDAIAARLSGTEWSADTLMEISDLITATGREFEDLHQSPPCHLSDD